MKVKEFIESLNEKGFVLMCGANGLTNKINSINMMENPDTLKWIKTGEFLLTTGYFMQNDEALQIDFINQLSKVNAAGVGIKKNRYVSELSNRVLEEAEKKNLPIILIPYEYSLSDVSSLFYKELYERQNLLLRKSITIHEQFMNIVLSGGGIKELGKELVKLINNPVIITNEYGKVLHNEGFEEIGYLDHKLLIDNQGEQMLNLEILKSYYDDIDIELNSKAIKHSISFQQEEEICFRIKPIVSDREINGYIIVAEVRGKMTDIDYMAVERASIIILLERMKEKAIEETKQLMRRDFFDDLLEGKIHSENELENIAMIYGLKPMLHYSCMVIQFNNNVMQYYSEKKFANQFREDMLNFIEIVAMKQRVKTVSIIRGGYLIIFIPFKPTMDSKENRDFSLNFASMIEGEFLEKYKDYNLSIGIGKSYPINSLSKSFKEAMESIKIANNFEENKNIVHFDHFMVYHLLSSSNNNDILRDFYNNSIKRLVDYDKKNNTNLIETLKIYFRCKGNMSEASKMLYIHRNTLLYRLDKIKEILNTDLENGEENLELQLGLHIMRLLSFNEG